MPSFRMDWKFFASIVAAVAGVAVPIWIWRTDNNARALNFQETFKTPLAPFPSGKGMLEDMKLTLANSPIDSPYLTSVDLVNVGARPILSTEFEAPIELHVSGDSKLIRASVTDVRPADLRADVVLDGNKLAIRPLLLNPHDRISLTILTSGGRPSFVPRTRIAGISVIPYLVPTDDQPSRLSGALALAGALLLTVAIGTVQGPFSGDAHLRSRPVIYVAFANSLIAGVLINVGLGKLGLAGWGVSLGALLLILSLGFALGTLLNRLR